MCMCGRMRGPANAVYFKRARAQYFPDDTTGLNVTTTAKISARRQVDPATGGLAVGPFSGCCRCLGGTRGNFGLVNSRGPKERNRQLHDNYGFGTESTASRRCAMPVRDWSTGRVFYQGLLSDRHATREATREKQTRAEKSDAGTAVGSLFSFPGDRLASRLFKRSGNLYLASGRSLFVNLYAAYFDTYFNIFYCILLHTLVF